MYRLYQNYRTMLARELKQHIPLPTVVRFHVWEQERCAAVSDELARLVRAGGGSGEVQSKVAAILDVGGMTISKHVNKDFLWLRR